MSLTGTMYWTVQFTEDWDWFCSGLWFIRKTDTWTVVDCGVYRGLVLGL